ncbi:biliverdin-producing heme oxygenase [Hydrocarboniphaga effusa]|jgi:heme oxygenase|uniref:biliverdin-producing heme oxygenase n=1 Tax=Hydrocarboniphaga effusa TaxID=243629 RepID=UPI0035ADC80F
MDLFASLKEETAVEHQALEDQLDLMRPGLTREHYIGTLQHFLGYVEPYERALQQFAPPDLADLVKPRLRCSQLVADLLQLGVSPGVIDELSRHSAFTDMGDKARWFGRFYVMEGSTLGGRVLGPHVARQLNLAPGAGNAYFLGHGAHTGPMWKAFRERMADSLAWTEYPATIAAARDCFVDLGRWFAQPLRGVA